MTYNLHEEGYRIGAVSRMTGIALPTLRMWERRYKVVTPMRTPAGGRIYNREHVARLALLQTAVQAGHQIGSVVHLSDAQLQARIRGSVGGQSAGRPSRIAVIGPSLPTLMLSAEVADPTIELVASHADVRQASALEGTEIDALILELPTFHADDLDEVLDLLKAVRARLTIVVYAFTNQIIAAVPASEPYLVPYAEAVNTGREALKGYIDLGIEKIQGLASSIGN